MIFTIPKGKITVSKYTMAIIILVSFILLYYLRNKEAKWLWLFFILITLSSGVVSFKDSGLVAVKVVLQLTSLIMAIVKTRKQGGI